MRDALIAVAMLGDHEKEPPACENERRGLGELSKRCTKKRKKKRFFEIDLQKKKIFFWKKYAV